MKVAVIGGGYTGISVAYHLSKEGVDVSVFEREKKLGGLAGSFSSRKWNWALETHYHHLFKSDKAFLELCKEINLRISFYKPRTSTYLQKKISYLDTTLSLLTYKQLSIVARLRTGFMIFYLKIIPTWNGLEKITAEKFIRRTAGKESWKKLWKPLFSSKFGSDNSKIPTSWFWARIKKRGSLFGYPVGGFESFVKRLVEKSKLRKVKFLTEREVKMVTKNGDGFTLVDDKGSYNFDVVVFTTSFSLLAKTVRKLPNDYVKKYSTLKYRGAINLVLSLKENFLPDEIYWLNVNEKGFPFLGIIEHTNFISKKYYNGEKVIYIGNYLSQDHKFFKMTKEEILQVYLPFLKRINSKFDQKWINRTWVFKSPFAQPVMMKNYSKMVPPFETPIKNLYLCNMQQVYPWDRQTNYALEFGKKVANLILESQ